MIKHVIVNISINNSHPLTISNLFVVIVNSITIFKVMKREFIAFENIKPHLNIPKQFYNSNPLEMFKNNFNCSIFISNFIN